MSETKIHSRSLHWFYQWAKMPLIIISGYPTSGKTHRARQLQSYLLERISSLPPPGSSSSSPKVHLVSDHTLSIPRSVYNLESKDSHERSNNTSEKDSRASIYAAVKRLLTSKDIVILDGANYIKGWRYQLYCEAKALRSTHCVVHIGAAVDQARRVNEERLAAQAASGQDSEADALAREECQPYERDCWDNLVFRYEEPNAMTRWDSPLFTVLWDDPTPPYEAIWDALIGSDAEGGRKVVRPNQATVLKAGSSEDYLYRLDRSTQYIINAILEWVKDHPGEGGGKVSVGENSVINLPANSVGLPTLQRMRRQFISLNRQKPLPAKRLKDIFVEYLNDAFDSA